MDATFQSYQPNRIWSFLSRGTGAAHNQGGHSITAKIFILVNLLKSVGGFVKNRNDGVTYNAV